MNSRRSSPLFASRGALAARVAACALAACAAGTVGAQVGTYRGEYRPPAATTDPIPELEGVKIGDKQGTQLPLETVLVDERGQSRTLGEILPRDHPTILQIGYMRCPQLCSLVMNALVRGMNELDWKVGEEFDVVSLSIDPTEKPELAAGKKAGYVAEYGRGADGKGWHFLTGDEQSIRAVTDAVGFGYSKRPNGEYSHAAGVFLITPDGKLSRVLEGVAYPAPTLRMGLLEASQGKIGSTIDHILLWCHTYDPNAQGYVLFAMHIMQLGGAVTVLVLFGGLAWFWWREWARSRLAPRQGTPSSSLAAGAAH